MAGAVSSESAARMRSAAPSRADRIREMIPGGQLVRYLCVGGFNTLFGYGAFSLTLHLLNHLVAARYLYLTVVASSVVSTPLSITVAYFGYKLFVFKTKGNYLREWIKCFGVYGVGMLPGLFVLSGLTRMLQSMLHMPRGAGYLAGAIVQGFTVIFSFLGHKNITFRQPPTGLPLSAKLDDKGRCA